MTIEGAEEGGIVTVITALGLTTPIDPSATPCLTTRFSAGDDRRDNPATAIPVPLKRAVNVSRCWRASTVVGATIATCFPASAASAAARSATSVLP